MSGVVRELVARISPFEIERALDTIDDPLVAELRVALNVKAAATAQIISLLKPLPVEKKSIAVAELLTLLDPLTHAVPKRDGMTIQ